VRAGDFASTVGRPIAKSIDLPPRCSGRWSRRAFDGRAAMPMTTEGSKDAATPGRPTTAEPIVTSKGMERRAVGHGRTRGRVLPHPERPRRAASAGIVPASSQRRSPVSGSSGGRAADDDAGLAVPDSDQEEGASGRFATAERPRHRRRAGGHGVRDGSSRRPSEVPREAGRRYGCPSPPWLSYRASCPHVGDMGRGPADPRR
jgi:hypothetical protein